MFSVIFEVHPGEGKTDEYLAHARELKPILEGIDGFIDNERFESRSRPGWVLSHSTWRDEKSVLRWRTQFRHHEIQEKGRFAVFSDYHLRVGEVTADTHPPEGVPVREQRFDETEVGRAKLCTIVELTPQKGNELPKHEDEVLQAVRLDRDAPGLHAVEVWDSIYVPGKILVLGSWAEASDASAFRPSEVPEAATVRSRAVRVIRDYGMFDRRETPQYFPDARSRNRPPPA
ncbi:antibiotic biosynthesis monooxygenase family protein [Methylobacterium sp. J-090]|uniref:antibiotic biosynthesis monooxygenase family protein n=1 Tax=Methylobacterium sp. J-090 TaxID=2836666 RepID=UPI001FB8E685|nr:antibiotic biosynthesis monooxygenase [Methylobacterium sp. J-090]MCJ2083511.1 antibiotic biosynthesis monooxygenase [Methylobacterium sp. J-090]